MLTAWAGVGTGSGGSATPAASATLEGGGARERALPSEASATLAASATLGGAGAKEPAVPSPEILEGGSSLTPGPEAYGCMKLFWPSALMEELSRRASFSRTAALSHLGPESIAACHLASLCKRSTRATPPPNVTEPSTKSINTQRDEHIFRDPRAAPWSSRVTPRLFLVRGRLLSPFLPATASLAIAAGAVYRLGQIHTRARGYHLQEG